MLLLITPQLEAIENIGDRYNFSEEDKIMLYNKAINVLKNSEHTHKLLSVLHKVLHDYVKKCEKPEGIQDQVRLLYLLSVQLYSVYQYNQLIELKAYQALKNVHNAC